MTPTPQIKLLLSIRTGSDVQVHMGKSDGVRLTEWANPAPDLPVYMCEFIYIHILLGAHMLAVPSVLGPLGVSF